MDENLNEKATTQKRTSCTECTRRKQKCDRQWPCSHCRSRKVSHLCRFKQIKKADGLAKETRPLKRRRSLSDEDSPQANIRSRTDKSDAGSLEKWGYINGADHFNLGQLDGTRANNDENERDNSVSESQSQAIQALPSRGVVNSLVHCLIESGNYGFHVFQVQAFLDEYDQWWNQKAKRQSLPEAFTSLLLQVCACSAQCPSPELDRKIEYELAEDAQESGRRFHEAGLKLAQSIAPGKGGVHLALSFLLAATWQKYEGRIVDAWHTLASAVREEQECGIHLANPDPSISDYETETRARVWCATVIWDWQMAEWLSRPMLTDIEHAQFRNCNLHLDESESGSLSPFAAMYEQYKIVWNLANTFGRLDSLRDPQKIQAVQQVVDCWLASLPSQLATTDLDVEEQKCKPDNPYEIPSTNLLTFAWMAKLTPLKRYLTQPNQNEIPSVEDNNTSELRDQAANTAIQCLSAACRLFNLVLPKHTRFHFVTFVLFDTATVLCSAILDDAERNLSQRKEILQTISKALGAVKQSSFVTQSGANSYALLSWLVSKLPLNNDERSLVRQSRAPPPPTSSIDNNETTDDAQTASPYPSEPAMLEYTTDSVDNVFSGISTKQDAELFPFDTESLPPDFFDWSNIDLGGMEQIWDWNDLNIGVV